MQGLLGAVRKRGTNHVLLPYFYMEKWEEKMKEK